MRKQKGHITSAKSGNTVTVTVHRHVVHPKYRKRYRISKKFLADTNGHDLHEGDEVVIGECRPLSKRKYNKVVEIIKKATQVEAITEESSVEEALTKEKGSGAGTGSDNENALDKQTIEEGQSPSEPEPEPESDPQS